MAYKPGSVPPLRGWAAIHLVRRSLDGSSGQPGGPGGVPAWSRTTRMPPYSTLLQAEFAAFHPTANRSSGGLVSVALVRALRRTGVTRCLYTLEPGLSSAPPEGGVAAVRPSRRRGSLARRQLGDEPVKGGYDSTGEPPCKIGIVKVMVKVGEDCSPWGEVGDEGERLVDRLVRGVREVAQR